MGVGVEGAVKVWAACAQKLPPARTELFIRVPLGEHGASKAADPMLALFGWEWFLVTPWLLTIRILQPRAL